MTSSGTPQAENQTALLAEDDCLIRELVSVYLERLGYHVLEAKNGKIALEILESQAGGPIDLIVTDLLMPQADGTTVIKAAQEKGFCDRFIVMSGNPVASNQSPPRYSDSSEYLEKPFTFGDFEAKVQSLHRQRAPQEA